MLINYVPISKVFSDFDMLWRFQSIEIFTYWNDNFFLVKIFLFVLPLFVILGYLWYASLFPFDAQKSTELQQSTENIKDLSKIMPKTERKTISYSVQPISNLPNEEIPLNSLHKALETWESLNPNLIFVESDKPDFII